MHRFYAPDLTTGREVVSLPSDEVAHLRRVLRLRTGALVRVFDGRGGEFIARVEEASPRNVTVRLIERHVPATEPRVAWTLAQALLKSDKMDRVLRDAVMLGVAEVQPFLCERTEVPRAALRSQGRRERWERIVLGSVKQCGRAVVPTVHEVRDFKALLSGDSSHARFMLLEPGNAGGASSSRVRTLEGQPRPVAATIFIGPEGGWTPGEVQAAVKAGVVPLTLGTRTLRADAAGAVAIAVLQYIWGGL